jgi:hypothetical protein
MSLRDDLELSAILCTIERIIIDAQQARRDLLQLIERRPQPPTVIPIDRAELARQRRQFWRRATDPNIEPEGAA